MLYTKDALFCHYFKVELQALGNYLLYPEPWTLYPNKMEWIF